MLDDIPSNNRTLLTTATGEAFTPIRLYYTYASRSSVAPIFRRLRCMDDDKKAGCWVWLYEREAAKLTFVRPRAELPAEAHPIVIGRFFHHPEGMYLAVRSTERAVQAARFFQPLFGHDVVLARARVINRWFEAREAADGLDKLDALLESNVTVIDPAESEERFRRAMAGAESEKQKLAALEKYRLEQRKRDVPLVEDFPLHAAEESADFRDLKVTLELRMVRASKHWLGNKVTLAELIYQTVEAKYGPQL